MRTACTWQPHSNALYRPLAIKNWNLWQNCMPILKHWIGILISNHTLNVKRIQEEIIASLYWHALLTSFINIQFHSGNKGNAITPCSEYLATQHDSLRKEYHLQEWDDQKTLDSYYSSCIVILYKDHHNTKLQGKIYQVCCCDIVRGCSISKLPKAKKWYAGGFILWWCWFYDTNI